MQSDAIFFFPLRGLRCGSLAEVRDVQRQNQVLRNVKPAEDLGETKKKNANFFSNRLRGLLRAFLAFFFFFFCLRFLERLLHASAEEQALRKSREKKRVTRSLFSRQRAALSL